MKEPSAEQRIKELGIVLPSPPEPFGVYAEAVQTGNLLFLTGMMPTEGRGAKFAGRVGAKVGRRSFGIAANSLWARQKSLPNGDRCCQPSAELAD
jgi:hypothetical protein